MVKFFRALFVLLLTPIFFCGIAIEDKKKAHADRGWEARGHGGYEKSFDLEEKFFWKVRFYLEHAGLIGLTEDQMEKIKTLEKETKKELIRRKADIEIASLEFKEALRKPKINVEATHRLLDQKYELKKAKTKYLVQTFARLKGILSEDQQEKVKDLWYGKKEEKVRPS